MVWDIVGGEFGVGVCVWALKYFPRKSQKLNLEITELVNNKHSPEILSVSVSKW